MIADTLSRAMGRVTDAPVRQYPFHHRSEIDLDIDAQSLFAHLDDHRRLVRHMEMPSLMMAGGTMRVETDAERGQAVGSLIRVSGRVLGIELAVEEVVSEHVPPLRKVWETVGEPRLLVIGSYRMGFTISPNGHLSRLVVFIDYQLPARGIAHGLALVFGRAYAAWCTRRMTTDAMAAISGLGPMVRPTRSKPPSEKVFAVCGMWLLGLGMYFLFIRPALLPEDLRYIGSSLDAIRSAVPGLERWLGHVFNVMGGFMVATGAMTVLMAGRLRSAATTERRSFAALAVAGTAGVALMSATNFALQSSYRWLLLAPALLWLVGTLCHLREWATHKGNARSAGED